MAKVKTGTGVNILYWLALLVLGILMIIGHQEFKEILYQITGIGLIAVAVIGGVSWWRSGDHSAAGMIGLLYNIGFLLLGIWIVSHPAGFDKLVNLVIALVVIILGLHLFYRGWQFDRSVPAMAAGVIAVIIGIVIAANNAVTTWVVILDGVALIYSALMGLMGERLLR